MALAGKTAEIHNSLQLIKEKYRQLWRAHTGSATDPFEGEGVDNLSISTLGM